MTAAITAGRQLRDAREAAGLSRDELALGFDTVPLAISAFARAEWVASIEAGIDEITDADLALLIGLVGAIAAALGRGAPAQDLAPAAPGA